MNSLYISYDGATDPLGQSQIIIYLEKLTERGIRFTLLSFDKPLLLADRQKVSELNRRLTQRGIKWTYLKYHQRPTVLATAYDLFKGIIVGARMVRLNKIKVVHARGYPPALIALILKKLFKLKFIFDVRGLWAEEKVDAGTWSPRSPLYKLTKCLEKVFFLNADAVVVLTRKAKNIIEALPYYKYNPVEINIIPTCVDLDRFKFSDNSCEVPEQLKNKFLIVYVGSLGTWYMLDEMIDFFKVSSRINSTSSFLLLTSDKDLVKERMQQKGIDHKDFYVNFVAYEKVPEWITLAGATVFFIMPSYSKQSSCPTKFAESLACGLPVITNSGIGDTEEIIRKEKVGVIAEDFSEAAYKKAFEQLLQLLSEGDALRRRCHAVAEKYFSLNDGIEKYQQIYQRLLKS